MARFVSSEQKQKEAGYACGGIQRDMKPEPVRFFSFIDWRLGPAQHSLALAQKPEDIGCRRNRNYSSEGFGSRHFGS